MALPLLSVGFLSTVPPAMAQDAAGSKAQTAFEHSLSLRVERYGGGRASGGRAEAVGWSGKRGAHSFRANLFSARWTRSDWTYGEVGYFRKLLPSFSLDGELRLGAIDTGVGSGADRYRHARLAGTWAVPGNRIWVDAEQRFVDTGPAQGHSARFGATVAISPAWIGTLARGGSYHGDLDESYWTASVSTRRFGVDWRVGAATGTTVRPLEGEGGEDPTLRSDEYFAVAQIPLAAHTLWVSVSTLQARTSDRTNFSLSWRIPLGASAGKAERR